MENITMAGNSDILKKPMAAELIMQVFSMREKVKKIVLTVLNRDANEK